MLTNRINAKQAIVNFDIYGLPSDVNIKGATSISVTDQTQSFQINSFESALIIPSNRDCSGSGTKSTQKITIGWLCIDYLPQSDTPDPLSGISPGATLGGFGLISSDLPGVIATQVSGNGDGRVGLGDEASSEFMDLYENQLLNSDFVPVNAAAPMIAVPTPYDAAVTLENIQTHIHTWIAKQLLDTAFSAQLDTSFQAAIAAYRANQPQTAIIQLQTMRTLIKQQQPDAGKNDVTPTINLPAPPALIDLLSARILYFDLGYVIGR